MNTVTLPCGSVVKPRDTIGLIVAGVIHYHGYTDKVWGESARAAVRGIAPSLCRKRIAWTSKDEGGDQPELAVKYWITGKEPVGNHLGERGEKMVAELRQRRR